MMPPRLVVLCAIFAAIMGLIIGASIFAPLEPKVAQHEAAQPNKTANAESEPENLALARYTYWLTVFTAILALATIGLGVATGGLYIAGERQLAHLQKSSERQSADMRAAIAENKRMADAAMAAVGSERAWMTFDRLEMGEATNGTIDGVPFSEAIVFLAYWKNAGRSPAIQAQVVRTGCLAPINVPDAPIFEFGQDPTAYGAPIGPNVSVGAAPMMAGDEDRARIFSRECCFILYTRVDYRDIFQPEIVRRSEVCMKVVFNGMTEVDGVMRPRWDKRAFGPQNTAS